MTYAEMLKEVRGEQTLSDFGAALGFSLQYVHDIEAGRRLPSVNFTNKLCEYLGRGPLGRKAWHVAGAKCHGWEI